jgi:hypothetical protein
MQVPARDEVVARWQLPTANAWAPYEKFTLLSALFATPQSVELPDVASLDIVRDARYAGYSVATAGVPRDAMWIVDLRGAASVAFASTLSRNARESVAVIPTFNNWPGDDELVPAEETLAALVTMAPRMPAPDDQTSIPVFMLDAWRLAYKEETVDDDTTDNRYMLSPVDFPSVEVLRAHGIRRVMYVVEDMSIVGREEDDLNALFLAYQTAGIQVVIVDPAWLVHPIPDDDTPYVRCIDARVVFIEPRVTIIDDPRFYARARGGFGGTHGVPYPGHGFSGHYGGYGGGFGFHGGG